MGIAKRVSKWNWRLVHGNAAVEDTSGSIAGQKQEVLEKKINIGNVQYWTDGVSGKL
jgi:hypothetical protein